MMLFFSSGARVSEAETFWKKPLSASFALTKTVTKLKGKKGTKQLKVPLRYRRLNTSVA
jgi:hypothetical protein